MSQPAAARVVVVSGGGTGIGKAIAARLVADGDHVVILGRRAGVLEVAAEELSAASSRPLRSAARHLGQAGLVQ